jgi:predicted MFS family arabinose efflux permease
MYGLFPFLVPYLMSEGASAAQAGLSFAAWGVGGLGYTFLVRQILRLVGSRGMMPTAGGITGAALALVPVAATWWATAALFLFVGFGFFMLHNTLQTQATEIAPAARASAMSLFAFSLFFGQGCGPIIFGAGVTSVGPGASIAISGVLIAVLGAVAGRLIRPAGTDRPLGPQDQRDARGDDEG